MRFPHLFRSGLSKSRGSKPTVDAQLQNERGYALVLDHTASGLVSAAFGDPRSIGDFQKSELQNRAFMDRVHLLDRVDFLKALDEACVNGQSNSVELRFRSKGHENGGWTWLACHVSSFRAQPNHPPLARARYENITALKLLQDELARTREALENGNAEHAKTISQVGHHIGNSLQVIMGNAELLARDDQNILGRVEHILHASQELNYFAEELRQLNGASHVLDTKNREDFQWHIVFDEVATNLNKVAKKRGISFVTDIPPSLPNGSIDLVSVKLLLANLLRELLAASSKQACIKMRARQFGPKVKVEFSFEAERKNAFTLKENYILGSTLKKLGGQLAFKLVGGIQRATLTLPIKPQNLSTPSPQHDVTEPKTVDEQGEYRARLSA